jgi:hypothetical protein
MFLSRHRNAGKNRGVKIANRCFENVAQFKYLGTTLTYQILLLLLLLTANGFSPGGSGTTIRQQTNNTLTTIRQHKI